LIDWLAKRSEGVSRVGIGELGAQSASGFSNVTAPARDSSSAQSHSRATFTFWQDDDLAQFATLRARS
jgi:hypothetical protein